MNEQSKQPDRSEAAEVAALRKEIDHMKHNVVCIPENFPGADAIRKNIHDYLKRGATKVAHLIMVIHEPQSNK